MARPKAIVPVSQERNFIRMMLYGQPDAGKSVLAGTSPRALILASDNEEPLSAARFGSNADMWLCTDYDEVDEAYEWVRHEGVDQYEWVWIDNSTLLQDQNMDSIMTELFIRKQGRTGDQSRYVPDRPQYLVNQNHFSDIVRKFKSLPIHFGVTAHEMVVEWHDGTEVVMPQLQGGKGEFSTRICGYMNIIGHMTSRTLKNGEWEGRLRVRHRPATDVQTGIMAKDRYAALGRQVINPNIPDMMEEIRKVLPTLGTRLKPTAAKKAKAKKVAPVKAAAKKASAARSTTKAPAKKAVAAKKGR